MPSVQNPRVRLEPMTPQAFASWRESSIVEYAANKRASGVWGEDALERSRAEFARLLPQGVETPDNHLFTAVDASEGTPVGALWVALGFQGGPRDKAWVCDVLVLESLRGKGFGRALMRALEEFARSLGVSEIGLHVFGHNTVARGLYESLGYETRSVVMAKTI